jgi:hypothetical protein
MQHQISKHGSLPGAANRDPSAAILELERAEDAYLHRPPFARCQRTFSTRHPLSNRAARKTSLGSGTL